MSDSFGYRSTAEHDLRYGSVTTTTVYDAVDRMASVVGSYEQGSGQVTIRFEYHPEAQAGF